jgi:glutamine synthetase
MCADRCTVPATMVVPPTTSRSACVFSTPEELVAYIAENDVEVFDIRFCDLLGVMNHLTVPASSVSVDSLAGGMAFDGSSIKGFQSIHESDMTLLPDVTTARVDPFRQRKTLTCNFFVHDPLTLQPYSRDPRNVARKAVNYLKSTGVADTCYIGPEAEFFIFDDIRFDQTPNCGFFFIDSGEGEWNRGTDEGPNLGYKLRHKEGYFPCPPADQLMDIRNEMMQTMIDCGMDVEAQHHEVATAGQSEIDLRFNDLLTMADNMCMYKYIVKNVARRHGKTVTFMPKPLFSDNGSGMHTHISFWKGDHPLFAGNGYAGLSDEAIYAIGGILAHAPALLAFACPTTNSYKRLVPGFEAPVNLAYSQRNRSAACRIPMYSPSPKAKRIEFRCPDPSSNPYLAFSALMMAALDGIQNKIHPGDPLDKDIYDLEPEELAKVPTTPGSLGEALDALAKDHEFLLRGDVFTQDVINT